jgi:hypothetical protein
MAGERVLGTSRVLLAMRQVPVATEHELAGELDALGQLVMNRMRRKATKFRSLMAISIAMSKPEPLVREIGPTVSYAAAQEEGVRPGGKGLPKFSDPDSKDIVDWLRNKAFSGKSTPRRNSMAAVRRELELRDRYEGLAWHIRHHGVKASPFIAPALSELEPVIRVRLQAAAERAIAQAGGTA